MDAEFHINQKKFTFKQVINDLHNIHKIASDKCEYCKRNNIKEDKDKLNLILKITKKYFGDDKNGK